MSDLLAELSKPSVLLSLAWGGYLLALALWILLQKHEPAATLGWLLGLAFLPLLGFLLYYLFGPRRIRRHRLRRLRARRSLDEALRSCPEPEGADLSHLAQAVGEMPPSSCTALRVMPGGSETIDALIQAIGRARHHVHLEYYIFEPDQTGVLVRDALVGRAQAGVRVRLLLDALGSARLGSRFLRPLREAGVELAWFHPMRLRRLWRPLVNLRNHRKLAVIDGRVGFVGGVNIADAGNERLSAGAYHDLHLRLEGPVLHWLQLVFVEDWHYATGTALRDAQLWPNQLPGPITAQVLPSGPDTPWEPIHRVQVSAIERARRRAWLATPYFVPGEAALMALTSAALRGVDVRLLVPRQADSRVVTWAARSYYDQLLQAGVRVFEYLPRMLHSKALLVDEATAIVGSANFDHRSFRLNFELSVLLQDAGVAESLEAIFSEDLAQAEEVRVDRPGSFPARLAEASARLLSPLL
jgi:cardiolipin synthase A/B